MATVTIFSDPSDGRISSGAGTTYSTVRAGTSGVLAADTTQSFGDAGQWFLSPNYTMWQTFIGFDTSTVTGTITGAVLNMTVNNNAVASQVYTTEVRARDWGTTVTTADWVAGASLGADPLVATLISSVSVTNGAAYDFVDVALPANINQAGFTRLSLSSDRMRLGTVPTTDEYLGWDLAETTGTTNDPHITIYSGTRGTITYRSTGNFGVSTGTSSLVATVPTTAATGDVLFYHIATNTSAAPTFPVGWTVINSQANSTTVAGHTITKVSDGTEAGTTVTVTGLGTHSAGFIDAYSGCDVSVPTSSPPSYIGARSAKANASGTKGSTSVTPPLDGCMIVLVDSVLIGTTHNTWLDGSSNAMTEVTADGGDGTTISTSGAYLLQTTAAATGVGTWSQPNNGAGVGEWIVLVPAEATGPPPATAVVTVDLYESGSFVQTLGTFSVDTTDDVLVLPWDAAVLATVSGANVELRITSDAQVDIGAVQWNAAYSTVGATGPSPDTGIEAWGLVLM